MTRSKVELAVFTKLICAYSLNTVAVPIFVSVLPPTFDRASHAFVGAELSGITQAWYESGGVVAQAAISGNRLVIGSRDGVLYCLRKP